MEVVAATQSPKDQRWAEGPADTVRQWLSLFEGAVWIWGFFACFKRGNNGVAIQHECMIQTAVACGSRCALGGTFTCYTFFLPRLLFFFLRPLGFCACPHALPPTAC